MCTSRSQVSPEIRGLEGPEAYDTANILVRFANGKDAIIDVCRQVRTRFRRIHIGLLLNCESLSASERQDEEQKPRETGIRQGRTPPTGGPHRGENPAEDPPPEGRATQGTHTEHTQTTNTNTAHTNTNCNFNTRTNQLPDRAILVRFANGKDAIIAVFRQVRTRVATVDRC